jgi:hypothetical protein
MNIETLRMHPEQSVFIHSCMATLRKYERTGSAADTKKGPWKTLTGPSGILNKQNTAKTNDPITVSSNPTRAP